MVRDKNKPIILNLNQKKETQNKLFYNDIPHDKKCKKCPKKNETIKILKNKLQKYEELEENNKNKIITGNVNIKGCKKVKNKKCLWDCCKFKDSYGALVNYIKDGIYEVNDYFCSFECALAYNLYYLRDNEVSERKTLTIRLFKELYKNKDIKLLPKEAPPRECLIYFGGTMTIDEFRDNLIHINREYIVYYPPMRPSNIIVEQVNNISQDLQKNKKYVLKRKKPLSYVNIS